MAHVSASACLLSDLCYQLNERVKKLATTTHKDRVHEFNAKLETLSEHHDIPKVGLLLLFFSVARHTDCRAFPGRARIRRTVPPCGEYLPYAWGTFAPTLPFSWKDCFVVYRVFCCGSTLLLPNESSILDFAV